MRAKFLILILLILIVSCSPFSQQVLQEVKKDIQFSDALKTPETFKGESVLWGGVIIETIAKPDDTLMIVRQTDLDFQKRPQNLDKSAGRFIISCRGFLDPAIYGKDREVTVVGKIAGTEKRMIGEYPYAYPVIESHALYLWEKWDDTPFYYDPWYFWNPYPYYWRPSPRYRN